jgi:hypothetical protein
MTLRIFTDPAALAREHQLCPLLLPWGEELTGRREFRFSEDPYTRTGRNYFARASPADSDLFICPFAWQNDGHNALVAKLAQDAQAAGKRLVVFCEADTEAPFPVPAVIVFRGSLKASRRLPNEFPSPAFILDHIDIPFPLPNAGPLPKDGPPVAGFCGYIDTEGSASALKRAVNRAVYWGVLSRPRLERLLRRCGIRITRSEGKRARYQALGVVRRCERIRSNFVLREQFLNGTLLVPEKEQKEHWRKSFGEFRENVLACHYTLCPRGGGNWSYRFYETLCLGRIPVFINTDCALPYASHIPWREHCVWVEGDRIEDTADAILAHYHSHSPESLAALQDGCRKLWLEFLSLDGFFRNFHRHPLLNRK